MGVRDRTQSRNENGRHDGDGELVEEPAHHPAMNSTGMNTAASDHGHETM
jgi:hypothetical protein